MRSECPWPVECPLNARGTGNALAGGMPVRAPFPKAHGPFPRAIPRAMNKWPTESGSGETERSGCTCHTAAQNHPECGSLSSPTGHGGSRHAIAPLDGSPLPRRNRLNTRCGLARFSRKQAVSAHESSTRRIVYGTTAANSANSLEGPWL